MTDVPDAPVTVPDAADTVFRIVSSKHPVVHDDQVADVGFGYLIGDERACGLCAMPINRGSATFGGTTANTDVFVFHVVCLAKELEGFLDCSEEIVESLTRLSRCRLDLTELGLDVVDGGAGAWSVVATKSQT